MLVHELATGVRREITGHGPHLSALALDPTGTALVTGNRNGVIRIGALAGREPRLMYGHSRAVTGVETIRLWPMPNLSGPPLHALRYDELLEKLRSLTNLRVVPDPDSATGYSLTTAPFPGWKDLPTW